MHINEPYSNIIHRVHAPLRSTDGDGLSLLPNFEEGGLDRILIFRERLVRKRGVTFLRKWGDEGGRLQFPSWHMTLWQRWGLVVSWLQRRITLSQRSHNVVFPTSLLRPKTNVVSTLRFRRRISDLVLTLQQRRDFEIVFLTKL